MILLLNSDIKIVELLGEQVRDKKEISTIQNGSHRKYDLKAW